MVQFSKTGFQQGSCIHESELHPKSQALKKCATLFLYLFIMVGCMLLGVWFGSTDLSLSQVYQVFLHKTVGLTYPDLSASVIQIVWNVRLPRVMLALAAGGGLAISGAAMQSITQNELADPYILGVSGGASAFAAAAICIGGIFATPLAIQTSAFVGALLSLVLVYFVGSSGNSSNATRLVLAGMAVSIMMTAFSQLFITLSSVNGTRVIVSWLMGSLASARWINISLPLFVSLVGLLFFMSRARSYNLMSLGDETALSLGVDAVKLKKQTGVFVALVSGCIVSICGIIGLVGFVVPHVVRILFGSDHRKVFYLTFIFGSMFMILMDLAARFVLAPQEVPVGVFTALVGGPFFVWLLFRRMRKVGG